jgi:hypothetical protein
MNDKSISPIHWSFWAIGGVALLWNGLGVINFAVQMYPDSLTAYRESERLIIEGRPAWATAAFAIAVCGGAIGSALLLLKKSTALYFFLASFLGVVLTMIHPLNSNIQFGIGEIVGIILMPLGVAAFLIWYSKLAERKEWIQ